MHPSMYVSFAVFRFETDKYRGFIGLHSLGLMSLASATTTVVAYTPTICNATAIDAWAPDVRHRRE